MYGGISNVDRTGLQAKLYPTVIEEVFIQFKNPDEQKMLLPKKMRSVW